MSLDESVEPEPRSWAYLQTPGFQSRQALAAWLVESFEHVVEIGGYRSPISRFLRRAPRSVTIIDPLVQPLEADTLAGAPCRVRHVAARFEDVVLDVDRYALVLLGFDIELDEQPEEARAPALAALDRLIAGADRVVVEWAVEWAPSRALAEHVIASADWDRPFDVGMHVRGPLGIDLRTSWPPLRHRRMVALDRKVRGP